MIVDFHPGLPSIVTPALAAYYPYLLVLSINIIFSISERWYISILIDVTWVK